MTLLSVVVPVHQVQGYLRQCLDSLLGQAFTDVEVVAVDDCSPDGSGAILAEYAARDPRLQVITLAENVGLGGARNVGLDHATGEYVWFVDSDDWLAPGALAAVARRLRETRAEVLVVGWDRVYFDGGVVAGTAVTYLGSAPETFTAEQWPRIVGVLHVAWNKVVRRDLLVRLGFRFAPGWYEDVSFTYPVLAAATRISTLSRVCVHYRQRRTGAITNTVGDRHFDIFAHWERAFALVDKYADRPDGLRPLMFARMVWHHLSVLRHADRVPPASRRRFFDRMHAEYHRHLPAQGHPVPGGVQGLRYRLVARGGAVALAALRLLTLAASVKHYRDAPARLASGVARPLRRWLFGAYYRLQLIMPLDRGTALYAAYWYRGVACNPAAIARKAAELAPGVRNVWVVSRARAAAMPAGSEYVIAGTLRYYRMLARARWLVNNVNWPNQVVKRRGAVHVMTHHGTPLKRMGLDQIEHPASTSDRDFAAQMRRADRWDFSITSNAHSTEAWLRAYPCRYQTLEVGYPRNDRLANATAADCAAARALLGLEPDERVVLYAPTHREWLPPGRPVLDVADLAEQLGPGTVLVRAHYFYTAARGASGDAPEGRIIDVSTHGCVEDLYLAADLLVTDYSSAMFDYAVLDRPVVVFAPDWPVYAAVRGVYFDLPAEPPGAVATTYPELLRLLRSGAYDDTDTTAARARFRSRFCYLDDGQAAERVVRQVLLGEPADPISTPTRGDRRR